MGVNPLALLGGALPDRFATVFLPISDRLKAPPPTPSRVTSPPPSAAWKAGRARGRGPPFIRYADGPIVAFALAVQRTPHFLFPPHLRAFRRFAPSWRTV